MHYTFSSFKAPKSTGLGKIMVKVGEKYSLQFGVYKILSGPHTSKHILAFRGTGSAMSALQDVGIFSPQSGLGQMFRKIVISAVAKTRELKPDYICGHSLGGLLAECVCSETGIAGAAFNAPGPWSPDARNNLTFGNRLDENLGKANNKKVLKCLVITHLPPLPKKKQQKNTAKQL